jgi:hypothetical protein
MKIRHTLCLIAILVIAVPASGQVLFGSEYGASDLFEIDPATGTFVIVGTPPTSRLPGLAYNPNTGTMYGTDETNLYIVDVASAGTTLVGAHGVASPITGLTFDVAFTTLYSIGYDGNLYSVNPATGTATLIGALGAAPNTIVDLATASDGTVYAVGTANSLYTINTSTGAATSLGSITGTSGAGMTAIAFDDGGTLYAIDTLSDRLMTLDTGTLVATYVGAIGIGGDVRGLAFVPLAIGQEIPDLNQIGVVLMTILLAAAGWLAIRS